MGRRHGFDRTMGVLLILGGIFFLLSHFDLLQGDLFLFYLSGAFFVVYILLGATASYGNIGFLIPASVLLAIASFAQFEERGVLRDGEGGLFFLFLAGAFFVVYLHTRTFEGAEWGARNWPAIPGVSLLAFGLFILTVELTDLRLQMEDMNSVAAVILIGLGCYFLYKGNRKRRSVKVENIGQKRD